ncbi:MAG: MBL fold metallo-hydrolase, partial [Aeromicrobium sp.]
PEIQVIEHQAHAPGHAALLIKERGVLVLGDMLSDVLVPMLDFGGAADPIEDYLTALELLEAVVNDVDVAVPGNGTIATADEIQKRFNLDRAYVTALRDGKNLSDPRIGSLAKPGWEWVSSIHEGQQQSVAQRKEGQATPDSRD